MKKALLTLALTMSLVLSAFSADRIWGSFSGLSWQTQGQAKIATWEQTPAIEYSPTNYFSWTIYEGYAYMSHLDITHTDPSVKAVSIPPVVNGYTVIGLISPAAYADGVICDVTIPDTVQLIGANCFMYTTSLTNVVIGAGIKTIEPFAFSGCSVKTITIRAMQAPTADDLTFSEGTACIIRYPAGATGYTDPWHGMTTEAY